MSAQPPGRYDHPGATSTTPPPGPQVSRPVAVLVFAAVLVGVLVTGVVVWASTPRLPTGPTLAPPAPETRVTEVDYRSTYEIEGLPSSYDPLLVVVIQLRSGDFAVAYSVRPDDLGEDTLDRLDASLASITAR